MKRLNHQSTFVETGNHEDDRDRPTGKYYVSAEIEWMYVEYDSIDEAEDVAQKLKADLEALKEKYNL